MNNLDMDQAANALYGDTTPPSKPTPGPSTSPAAPLDLAKAEDALYRNADDHVDEQTGLDKVYHAVQAEIVSAGVERLGVDKAEAQASSQAWAEVFRDADVNTTEASTLVQVAVSALANGVDDDTVGQWAIDAKNLIRTEFGATSALALKDARAYVAQHPKLAAYLDQTGLGNHPRVVLAAARKGRALRAAGKL